MKRPRLIQMGWLWALLGALGIGTAIAVKATLPLDLPVRRWSSKPLVLVTTRAPVTVNQVRMALDVWKTYGAPELEVHETAWEPRVPVDGVVVIDAAQGVLVDGRVAQTTLFSDEARHNYAGLVELTSSDLAVLIHELGHLWLGHVDIPGHVMARGDKAASVGEIFGDNSAWRGVKEALGSLETGGQP